MPPTPRPGSSVNSRLKGCRPPPCRRLDAIRYVRGQAALDINGRRMLRAGTRPRYDRQSHQVLRRATPLGTNECLPPLPSLAGSAARADAQPRVRPPLCPPFCQQAQRGGISPLPILRSLPCPASRHHRPAAVTPASPFPTEPTPCRRTCPPRGHPLVTLLPAPSSSPPPPLCTDTACISHHALPFTAHNARRWQRPRTQQRRRQPHAAEVVAEALTADGHAWLWQRAHAGGKGG